MTYAIVKPDARGGLPWDRCLPEAHPTGDAAYAAALQWCKDYERRDPFGNMACILGVAEIDGKFHGVVNYYHSNT